MERARTWRKACNRKLAAGCVLLSLSLLGAACAEESPVLELENPNLVVFQQAAYPILLRDCGFPACHGNTDRFFRVYGPGRTRLVPTTPQDEPVMPDEIQESYTRAVSMLVHDRDLIDSPLLHKPLDTSAGGPSHAGEDAWGRNVYVSTSDPGYAALVNWAYSNPPMPVPGPTP